MFVNIEENVRNDGKTNCTDNEIKKEKVRTSSWGGFPRGILGMAWCFFRNL